MFQQLNHPNSDIELLKKRCISILWPSKGYEAIPTKKERNTHPLITLVSVILQRLENVLFETNAECFSQVTNTTSSTLKSEWL